jgi:putative transposase
MNCPYCTGRAGKSWDVDETSIQVHGKWCYLYRASDHDGNLVASRLSEKRERDAANQLFSPAMAVVGHAPETVTPDGHRSSPRAIRETMGNDVAHRTNVDLNNRLEHDHRGITHRSTPMRGGFVSAAHFCRACDALCQYFRSHHTARKTMPLAQDRRLCRERCAAVQKLMAVVS